MTKLKLQSRGQITEYIHGKIGKYAVLEELDYRKIKRVRDKKFVAALKRQKQELTRHHKKFQADTGAIFKHGGLPTKPEKFKCLADSNYHEKESPQNKKYLTMIQDTSHKIT